MKINSREKSMVVVAVFLLLALIVKSNYLDVVEGPFEPAVADSLTLANQSIEAQYGQAWWRQLTAIKCTSIVKASQTTIDKARKEGAIVKNGYLLTYKVYLFNLLPIYSINVLK